jgi:hypothetical protein
VAAAAASDIIITTLAFQNGSYNKITIYKRVCIFIIYNSTYFVSTVSTFKKRGETNRDKMESAAAATATDKKTRVSKTDLVVIQSIADFARDCKVTRNIRQRDPETGDMTSREEIVGAQVSSNVFVPIDERICSWLKTYARQLADIRNRPTNRTFVQLRKTKVAAFLANSGLSASEQRRAFFNVCNLASACIENAIDSLHSAITIYARDVMPFMDLIEAVLFIPMANGHRTADDEEAYFATVAPKRKRSSSSSSSAKSGGAGAGAGGEDDDSDDNSSGSGTGSGSEDDASVAPPAPKAKAKAKAKVVKTESSDGGNANAKTTSSSMEPKAKKARVEQQHPKVTTSKETVPKSAPRPPKAPTAKAQSAATKVSSPKVSSPKVKSAAKAKAYDDEMMMDINATVEQEQDDFSGGYSE